MFILTYCPYAFDLFFTLRDHRDQQRNSSTLHLILNDNIKEGKTENRNRRQVQYYNAKATNVIIFLSRLLKNVKRSSNDRMIFIVANKSYLCNFLKMLTSFGVVFAMEGLRNESFSLSASLYSSPTSFE